MSFFGINFGGGAEIDIILDDADTRKMADIKDENGRKERFYLFYDGESVVGKVNITLHRKTGKIEHQGIKIELIGSIEMTFDRATHLEFLSLTKELARPGELTQNTSFDFEFNQVEKPYESYAGVNVRLRYFLKVTMERRLSNLTKELDLAVHTLASYPDMNNPIKMEVGIEECLHIEFEYNKSKYHLKDVIVGKIYFLLVRIKIKHMEIAIIKKETCGTGPNTYQESEHIAKYEIMDGAPVRGESIPIRVFLAGYDLTPTMRDINKKFNVRYYLNLILVDEEDRRYFKQQEITLWRKGERSRKLPLSASLYQQQHALARHTAGDQPTEGVRTAPTPSLPPTPCVDTTSGFPGPAPVSVQEESNETADQGEEQVSHLPKDKDGSDDVEEVAHVVQSSGDHGNSNGVENTSSPDLAAKVKNDEAEDKDVKDKTAEEPGQSDSAADAVKMKKELSSVPPPPVSSSPPDIVSSTADLNLNEGDEVGSTKDLDVVSGGSAALLSSSGVDLDSPDDLRDSPPEMMDTPSSPDIDLPDPPGSDPDSPHQLHNNITDDQIPAGAI